MNMAGPPAPTPATPNAMANPAYAADPNAGRIAPGVPLFLMAMLALIVVGGNMKRSR